MKRTKEITVTILIILLMLIFTAIYYFCGCLVIGEALKLIFR